MYSINDMRNYARRLGFGEAYMAEKDYLQELLLMEIFSKVPENRLVFRGGTALAKIYGSGRFSDDLDFVANEIKDRDALLGAVKGAINAMNDVYETTFTGPDTYKDMISYEIKINGPLFVQSQHEASRQRVSIDINLYEKVILTPLNLIRTPIYNDIPPYSLVVKQIEELLMDKVAALMERKRLPARDLYDIWAILVKNRANLDKEKIGRVCNALQKTKGITYSALTSRIASVKPAWREEMSSLTNTPIEFNSVETEVKTHLKELLRLR